MYSLKTHLIEVSEYDIHTYMLDLGFGLFGRFEYPRRGFVKGPFNLYYLRKTKYLVFFTVIGVVGFGSSLLDFFLNTAKL